MLRLQDVQLEREWRRIDRRVSQLLSDKWTGEAAATMLAILEADLEVVSEVAIQKFR
jgi:hypothetical protein